MFETLAFLVSSKLNIMIDSSIDNVKLLELDMELYVALPHIPDVVLPS